MRISFDRLLRHAAPAAAGLALAAGLIGALVPTRAPPPARLPTLHVAPPPGVLSPTAPQQFAQLDPQQAAAINAQIPVSTLPNPAAAPFSMGAASAADKARALNCLTMAIYFEAATQSDDGQAAVAQVVLNRVRNPLFPKSVCGVVFQGSDLPTGCQFTFTCDGSLARQPSAAGWKHAQDIAERALDGYVAKAVGEATHYHTIWVVPYWQSSVLKLTQIGAHIFYRWRGGVGLPDAFTAKYAGGEFIPLIKTAQLSMLLGHADPLQPIATVQVGSAPSASDAGSDSGAGAAPDTSGPPPPVEIKPAAQLAQNALMAPPPAVPQKPASYFGGHGDEARGHAPAHW